MNGRAATNNRARSRRIKETMSRFQLARSLSAWWPWIFLQPFGDLQGTTSVVPQRPRNQYGFAR